jgi:hypothetical protein
MIDRAHDLPITRQAELVRISRGSIYYRPRGVPEVDLAIMRRLDRLHLEYPFAGSRMLRGLLAAEGCKIGRRHVKTLMRRMGMEALYRRPRTEQTRARPQGLLVSLARDGDRAAEPGVGDGPHLHPDGARLRLSGGGARLGEPPRTGVAAVDHHGGGVLRRGVAGGNRQTRQAADRQHRPGQPVHRCGLHRRARRPWHRHQHGRQGRLAGQRVRRAAVAQRQIRRGLSARLRQRQRGPRLDRPLLRVLQPRIRTPILLCD